MALITVASLLLLGLLLGMRHALEADHLAAVATLVGEKQSLAEALKLGGAWGLGHTITLLLFGSIVLFMDSVIPERLASGLELAVGVMLVLLGIDLLRKIVREKIHFHGHRHGTDQYHFHAHSHSNDPPREHASSPHNHQHSRGFPMRALAIGLVHGMAGSAALILLTVETVNSPLQGLLSILAFGVGSILGMSVLSVAISLPLRMSAERLTGSYNLLHTFIGTMTLILGLYVIIENRAMLPV